MLQQVKDMAAQA